MKLSVWAKRSGISYQTAWRWHKNGKLPVKSITTPTGTILVEEHNPTPETITTIVYARVSSANKRDDLHRQAERVATFCTTKGWVVHKVVKEIASGMNDKRPKLMKALETTGPCRLVVEHKDRLTRFGFNYLETLLPKMGWEIVVVNRNEDGQSDLMQDLVSVILSKEE
jgi:predicted site-specific integrase-resolvase